MIKNGDELSTIALALRTFADRLTVMRGKEVGGRVKLNDVGLKAVADDDSCTAS